MDALATARRVYVDANPIIYFVEDKGEMRKAARRAYRLLIDNEAQLVTSTFTLAECLHGAFKRRNSVLVERYQSLFEVDNIFEVAQVDLGVLNFAAKFASVSGLKLVDAVHFATAFVEGCDAFLTNDKRFRSGYGINVALLSGLKPN